MTPDFFFFFFRGGVKPENLFRAVAKVWTQVEEHWGLERAEEKLVAVDGNLVQAVILSRLHTSHKVQNCRWFL